MKQINKKDDLQFPQEHVFLVDCIGSQSSHSEAAYYSSAPVASPDTIAIVTYGALRQWEERTTNATFTDAGSEHQTGFTVTLGPRPKDGEIAGNATNTWNTSFACYAEAPRFLYTREDSNCSSQYDCSHAGFFPSLINACFDNSVYFAQHHKLGVPLDVPLSVQLSNPITNSLFPLSRRGCNRHRNRRDARDHNPDHNDRLAFAEVLEETEAKG
ncbi:hypothetical protein F5Y10DRAFT_271413 [Nemania abortiva]|nr:hypothetical protein F5Y10DRAFT_271413 [Nemania abortiva]